VLSPLIAGGAIIGGRISALGASESLVGSLVIRGGNVSAAAMRIAVSIGAGHSQRIRCCQRQGSAGAESSAASVCIAGEHVEASGANAGISGRKIEIAGGCIVAR
jgi:hypothetical protein